MYSQIDRIYDRNYRKENIIWPGSQAEFIYNQLDGKLNEPSRKNEVTLDKPL